MWMCSSGPYGALHLPTEMRLRAAGGLRMRHVPTTGGGPALTQRAMDNVQLVIAYQDAPEHAQAIAARRAAM